MPNVVLFGRNLIKHVGVAWSVDDLSKSLRLKNVLLIFKYSLCVQSNRRQPDVSIFQLCYSCFYHRIRIQNRLMLDYINNFASCTTLIYNGTTNEGINWILSLKIGLEFANFVVFFCLSMSLFVIINLNLERKMLA